MKDLCTPLMVRKEEVMGAPAFVLETPKGERIAFGAMEDLLYRIAKHFNGDQESTPVIHARTPVGTLKDWVEKYLLESNHPVGRKELLTEAFKSGRSTTMGGVTFYLTKMKKDGKIKSIGKGLYVPAGKR